MSTTTTNAAPPLSRLFQPSLGVLFILIAAVTFWAADGGRDHLEAATWLAFGLSQVLTAASTAPPARWASYGFALLGVVLFGAELSIALG